MVVNDGADTRARSIAKTASWLGAAALITALIVYAFTADLTLSIAVGVLDLVAKAAMLRVHKLVWNRLSFGRREPSRASVLWLTGLSGSGKSTISDWVAGALRAKGVRVEQLDGDAVRHIFPSTGFTKADRDSHIRRVGYLASKLEQNGVTVVASFVSPYQESREFVRGLCRNFLEVHVSTPLPECERRDVKGLYGKARRGEIRNFTGIDDPYEIPESPDLALDTTNISVDDAGRQVLRLLRNELKE